LHQNVCQWVGRLCPDAIYTRGKGRKEDSWLLLAYVRMHCVGRSLGELVVRRNAVRQRSDWRKSQSWSDEFYWTLRSAARSYDDTERQIARLLDTPSWTMLPDRLFRHVRV